MQRFPRQIVYSYLNLSSLMKISQANKLERQILLDSRIVKLRDGPGVTCTVSIQESVCESTLRGICYSIGIADHLHIVLRVDEWDSNYHDLDLLGDVFSKVVAFFTHKYVR